MTAPADTLIALTDGSGNLSGAFRDGDIIDLGSGVTWRINAALARSLNRDRSRAVRFRVRARAVKP